MKLRVYWKHSTSPMLASPKLSIDRYVLVDSGGNEFRLEDVTGSWSKHEMRSGAPMKWETTLETTWEVEDILPEPLKPDDK